jgi:hypothetical protein
MGSCVPKLFRLLIPSYVSPAVAAGSPCALVCLNMSQLPRPAEFVLCELDLHTWYYSCRVIRTCGAI